MKVLERYKALWDKDDSGCYVWGGSVRGGVKNPRPSISENNKSLYVTRVVCEETYGPPPSHKHQAAHKPPCKNYRCVNPDHLYWATPSQNMLDRPVEDRVSQAKHAAKPEFRASKF